MIVTNIFLKLNVYCRRIVAGALKLKLRANEFDVPEKGAMTTPWYCEEVYAKGFLIERAEEGRTHIVAAVRNVTFID